VRLAPIPPSDTVLLIDVLHYLQLEEQDALLRKAARALRPNGRVVIREADGARGLRTFATLLEEGFFTAIGFNRGERVRLRDAREIASLLDAEGLETETRPAWGKTPFSNVLIVGRRAHRTTALPSVVERRS
jgi:hypothetical protein